MFTDLLNTSENVGQIEQNSGALSGYDSTDFEVMQKNQTYAEMKTADCVHAC